jgi:phenolic acid decarboxylase
MLKQEVYSEVILVDDMLECIIELAEARGWEVLFYIPDADDKVHGITIGPKFYVDEVERHFSYEEDTWIKSLK